MEQKKLRAGIIGATGYVGQRLVCLLDAHPWFTLSAVAASPRSAGKTYQEAVQGRWKLGEPMPGYVKELKLYNIEGPGLAAFLDTVDFVYCAVDMPKADIRALEERIARMETPVVSNNSAFRMDADIPMMIPEINFAHAKVIEQQRKRLGTQRGFITAKPNCSIQSYVPALTPLLGFGLEKVHVCTYQAISGAGKTFQEWPEMIHNLIPYIGGEEEKSEQEPLKIWGELTQQGIVLAQKPVISAQCYRVSVKEGHTAAVSVSFGKKPAMEEIIHLWETFETEAERMGLPHAPSPFLRYCHENDRPQPLKDANDQKGMGITIGRLRPDAIFDYKFACLSHNTLRGAAGGSMLTSEMLARMGYLTAK